MLVRQIASASLAFLVALSAAAQQEPQRTYGETLEIRVINVDVVVTDRSGNPVTGLTKGDFELFENGRRKEVSNFLEINERAARGADVSSAQAAPGGRADEDVRTPRVSERRHLILFIDNTSLQPMNRNRVLAAMTSFVETTMRGDDEAMVVSWNPGLKENLALTHDRAQVLAALQTMSGVVSQGAMLRAQRDETENELRGMVHDFRNMTFAGEPRMSAANPPPEPDPADAGSGRPQGSIGNKVKVIDEKPPYDRALGAVRQYADSVMLDTKQKANALTALMSAFRGVQGRKVMLFVTESFSTQPARQMFEYLDAIKDEFEKGNFQNPRAEIMKYNDEPLFQTVTAAANASGITLYPISAAGVTGGIDGPDASESGGAVQYQTVGKAPGKFADQSLQELAAATGGLAVTGTNNFNLGLDRIASDLTMYYSLGYRADTPPKDLARNLEVKVKKPGVVVRYRQSFLQKTPPTEIGDTMSANLFAGVQKNDLGITIAAGPRTVKNDDEIVVPIAVTIPIASLTFVPDGKDVVGRFAIFAGFTRKDGSSSKVSKVEYPLRFPADSMQDQRNLTVKIAMTMQKSTENVSVGVLDETSNATGFATIKLP